MTCKSRFLLTTGEAPGRYTVVSLFIGLSMGYIAHLVSNHGEKLDSYDCWLVHPNRVNQMFRLNLPTYSLVVVVTADIKN